MGRGRGKGKRLTSARIQEQDSGGEEVLPSFRRRGRPQKPLKDDETARKEEGEEEDEDNDRDNVEITSEEETKASAAEEKEKKRKRSIQGKDGASSTSEEVDAKRAANLEGPLRSSGFRQNGSRRKNTPRRAAEAGVECS